MLCLTSSTDDGWVALALGDLASLLADHAHCEMKAASNALSLATRVPAVLDGAGALALARDLVLLAEEELAHYRAVLAELDARAIPLGKPAVDEYALELRGLAGRSPGPAPRDALVDRLLVGALIEARSCERFRLLADSLLARGDGLARFYDDLFASEARHYTTLVDMAAALAGDERQVRGRLATLAEREGELAARFGKRPTIHG